jgi:hypothetical protein
MKALLLCATGLLLLGLTACDQKPPPAQPAGTNAAAAKAPATNAAPNYSSGNPVTAPVDYLGAVGQAQKRAVKTIDTASLNQAIQLFYSMENRFPKDLNELVAERYIGKIPDAPQGMKIVYNAKDGQVKIVPATP